jgi:hypothetical protein
MSEEPAPDAPLAPDTMVARYDELIAIQEQALARMRELRDGLPEAARRLVNSRDIEPLEELVAQARRRRAFWQGRQPT